MSLGSVALEPHDHVVNFYDSDEHLIAPVTTFLATALRSGDAALLVATRSHRDEVERRLHRDGFDCSRLRKSGSLVSLEAGKLLSAMTAGATLDGDRFLTVAGDAIDRLSAGGRHVRAFGEIVALLWEAGNPSGAVELESLWNELARTRQFSLYCAYPIAALTDGDLTSTNRVCDHHSRLVGPRSYESGSRTRLRGSVGSHRSELFVPVVSAVAAARRFVRDTLDAWDEPRLAGDAMLVTSELATNAVRHACSAFRVSIRRDESHVRIAVHDISPAPPTRREPTTADPGGRGLAIVDRLSTRWGSEARADGKVVWSELARAS